MSNFREIDISTWNRKHHFEFFRSFENPFFNMTANVDVSRVRTSCKKANRSFFLTILHTVARSLNSIEQFRYRVLNGTLVLYDQIDASSTVLNEDETFSFLYFGFHSNLEVFVDQSNQIMEAHRKKPVFDPMAAKNLFYFSSIPWVSYNHISHAKRQDETDFIPRIAVGKYFETEGTLKMPLSIEVHHALCDGLHVGRLYERIQKELNEF